MWNLFLSSTLALIASSNAADLFCSLIVANTCVQFDRIINVASPDDVLNVVGQAANFQDVATTSLSIDYRSEFEYFPDGVFTAFPNLKTIDLRDVSLEGIGPGAMGTCGKLEELSWQTTSFTRLPSGFGDRCLSVKTLRITQGLLKTLAVDALRGFDNLEHLDLISNQITCIPPSFLSFAPNLVTVLLLFNQITAIDPNIVRGLPNLISINFYANRISNIPNLDITGTATSAFAATIGVGLNLQFNENPVMAVNGRFLQAIYSSRANFDINIKFPETTGLSTTCFTTTGNEVDANNWSTKNATFSPCYTNWTPAMENTPVPCAPRITTTTAPMTVSGAATEVTTKAPPSVIPQCNPAPCTQSPCCDSKVLELVLNVVRNVSVTFN